MATGNNTYRKISLGIGLTFLAIILLSNSLFSQSSANQRIELPNIAIVNILNGIQSDNYGLKMSCIYFAGKYKILDVSDDLLDEMKKSDNEELSNMLVWSLYQIGNKESCQKLRNLIEKHPSESVRDFCKYLHSINEYETAIVKEWLN